MTITNVRCLRTKKDITGEDEDSNQDERKNDKRMTKSIKTFGIFNVIKKGKHTKPDPKMRPRQTT